MADVFIGQLSLPQEWTINRGDIAYKSICFKGFIDNFVPRNVGN